MNVKVCECKLSGREHYVRRCPRCGLYRGPIRFRRYYMGHEFEHRRRLEHKQAALQLLDTLRKTIDTLLADPPKQPKAIPPRDPSCRTEDWLARAAFWERKEKERLNALVHKPVNIWREMAQKPPQRRYLKAAYRMVTEYAAEMKKYGWDIKVPKIFSTIP